MSSGVGGGAPSSGSGGFGISFICSRVNRSLDTHFAAREEGEAGDAPVSSRNFRSSSKGKPVPERKLRIGSEKAETGSMNILYRANIFAFAEGDASSNRGAKPADRVVDFFVECRVESSPPASSTDWSHGVRSNYTSQLLLKPEKFTTFPHFSYTFILQRIRVCITW